MWLSRLCYAQTREHLVIDLMGFPNLVQGRACEGGRDVCEGSCRLIAPVGSPWSRQIARAHSCRTRSVVSCARYVAACWACCMCFVVAELDMFRSKHPSDACLSRTQV